MKKLLAMGIVLLLAFSSAACNREKVENETEQEHNVSVKGAVKTLFDENDGAISAVCPEGWNNFSEMTKEWNNPAENSKILLFNDSVELDYNKPYFVIRHCAEETLPKEIGEEISFELGGKAWAGYYDKTASEFNITAKGVGGGIWSVVVGGLEKEEPLFELVLSSVEYYIR